MAFGHADDLSFEDVLTRFNDGSCAVANMLVQRNDKP
jgi:hypothetical protein